MPIYKGRREGTWRVTVYGRGRQSEQIVEGSRGDARAVEAKLLLELRSRPSTQTRRAIPTFSSFCAAEYAPHAELHLGARTWSSVRIYQLVTLRDHFGPLRLDAIDEQHVEAFKQARSALGRQPRTINLELQVLGTMLRFAREDCRYPLRPLRIRPMPKPPRGRVRVWTREEVDRLLALARRTEPELAPLLVFLANTGCRKGEALAAQWSWVDGPGRLLRIPATSSWHPKSKRAREVPLSASLLAELAAMPRRGPWIFGRLDGLRRRQFPQAPFAKLVKSAGLEGGPHTLRHTYASLFLRARPDIQLLARVLGHSSAKITEIYVHLLPGHLDEARDIVDIGGARELPPDGRRGAVR